MSGGSMHYLYQRVRDADFHTSTPERAAFYRHLMLVADALQAIEWVDSGDSATGDESEAIRRCIPAPAIVGAALEIAERAMANLTRELAAAKEEVKQ